jgi:hypothetical protein
MPIPQQYQACKAIAMVKPLAWLVRYTQNWLLPFRISSFEWSDAHSVRHHIVLAELRLRRIEWRQ